MPDDFEPYSPFGSPMEGKGGGTPAGSPAKSPFSGKTGPSPYKLSSRGTYEIWSSKQNKMVSEARTIQGARRAVDRRDNAYGAYDHYIKRAGPNDDNGDQ